MSAWPYVIVAYAVALGTTALIALASWHAMRRAEQDRL